MKNRVAIIGCGAVKIGRYPDRAESELALEAIKLALEDADTPKDQIEGLFTTPDLVGNVGLQTNLLCEYMRITPKFMAEICCGAIAGGLAIRCAMNEIMLGNIDVAVCYGAEREASIGWFENFGAGQGSTMLEPVALQAYGSRGIIWAYALSACRYMHETGAQEEHFALASVRNRRNAMDNPVAAFTAPITVDDVMKSRQLCSPIKLLDSAASLDGAAAVVIASEGLAKKVCDKPVYIAGWGQYHDNSCFIPTDGCNKSISTFVSAHRAAEEAFKTANITPGQVDVAEIYAPFSPHELIIPEDIGWFDKGGMITAIEKGDTEIGGKIPINTDGGILSRGHPWGATPFYETIAIVRQLRGEAGRNQVDRAKIGLVHCEGGMLNNSIVIILRRD
ncbi:MAG TPA: thiolase family protein [Dehalococcoidia bacterium]|nr:thiolase family protein [Dehalococcoidia bacterium]